MKRMFIAGAVLLVFLLCANSDCSVLELRVKYWLPKIEGDVRVDEGDIIGTIIDVEEVLGIEADDEKAVPVELIFNLGSRFRLWFSHYDVTFEGSSFVADEFVFAGDTFFVSANIESSLHLKASDVGIELDLAPGEMLGLGLSASATLFDGEASLTDINTSLTASDSLKTVVPAIGGFAKISLLDDTLEIYGRVLGMSYEDDTYIDFVVEGRFEVFANLSVIGGYRSIRVDVEEDLVFVDAELSGFFIGGALSF